MHNTEMPLTVEDLESATTEVLTALGVPFDNFPLPPDIPQSLLARVSIRGERALDLSVEVPAGVAAEVAALFFGTETRSLTASDLFDAMGELANITAGAIKPMLDGHWTIGIPDRVDVSPITDVDAILCKVPMGRGIATITVALAATVPDMT